MGSSPKRAFPTTFDDEFATVGGGHAFFGLDVLQGLIEGLDEFMQSSPKYGSRSMGTGLLGCAMWINDPDLIKRIEGASAAAIVVTKQKERAPTYWQLARLRRLNEKAPGLPIRAFPDLRLLAPKVDGEARVVGPHDATDETVLPTFRALGYRKKTNKSLVPILHAKLLLVGELWWHDEGPLGHVEDVVGFSARRLWIGSANFTRSSRESLEFGQWTEDQTLIAGAERFLLKLVAASEEVDPDADYPDPDLAEVEFDDVAMAEALSDDVDVDEEER